MPSLVVDPEWPHPERSVNADERRRCASSSRSTWRSSSATTPALLAKVTPTYPPFGKRMLQDNGTWLATLQRDNVELVTDPIAAITPRGVRCADGTEHRRRRDRLRHRLPRQPLPLADGDRRPRRRHAARAAGATSRAPISASPCPAFRTCSASTAPAPTSRTRGSIIFHSECQVRYVMGCLRGAAARRLLGDGLPAGRARRLRRALRRAPRDAGVVASRDEQLVQERQRPRDDHVALAPGRLLGLDAGRRTWPTTSCAERPGSRHQVEELATARSGHLERRRTRHRLQRRTHAIGDVGPPDDFLDRRDRADVLERGAKQIRVGGHRREQRRERARASSSAGGGGSRPSRSASISAKRIRSAAICA